MGGQAWAFDAVYIPFETALIADCPARGFSVVTGLDLFLNQGVEAFEVFSGIAVDAEDAEQDLFRWGAEPERS